MSTGIRQVVVLLLAASAAYVGAWALFAPAAFYRTFPGLGMHWTAADGPYNEHFVRDVGGLYLALLVISVGAARHTAFMRRIAGAAWFVFSLPHFVYHLAHLDEISTTDAWLESIALGLTLLGALVLLLPERELD